MWAPVGCSSSAQELGDASGDISSDGAADDWSLGAAEELSMDGCSTPGAVDGLELDPPHAATTPAAANVRIRSTRFITVPRFDPP